VPILDGEKSFTICLAVLTDYRRVTDRQTDRETERQTDGHFSTA